MFELLKARPSLLIVPVVCITVLLFAFFIWPTQYYYATTNYEGSQYKREHVWRINRFTGETTIANPLHHRKRGE